jgi:hypothetical protein
MQRIMREAVFVALMLCGLAMTGQISTAVESEKATAVATLVERIKLSSSNSERVSLASELKDLLWQMDRSELDVIDRNTIDQIALMLSDNNEATIYVAAFALGHIGKPASHTVPALLAALREIEFGSRSFYKNVDFGSIDTIVGALIKLKCMRSSTSFL